MNPKMRIVKKISKRNLILKLISKKDIVPNAKLCALLKQVTVTNAKTVLNLMISINLMLDKPL